MHRFDWSKAVYVFIIIIIILECKPRNIQTGNETNLRLSSLTPSSNQRRDVVVAVRQCQLSFLRVTFSTSDLPDDVNQ